jgi:hypothetical protein
VPIFADVGSVYLNFGLWAFALLPGWLVVKEIGVTLGDNKLEREKTQVQVVPVESKSKS